MANPRLPGIPETEEILLYAKLNEYNRGRTSFKEAGAYLIVLPRRDIIVIRCGFTRRPPKDNPSYSYTIFRQISMKHYEWPVPCFTSQDAACSLWNIIRKEC